MGCFSQKEWKFWQPIGLVFLVACLHGTKLSAQAAGGKAGSDILQADPTIFLHQNTYYLYGTSGHDANQGFVVYTSLDLKTWEGPKGNKEGYALRKGDAFGDKGFWAPQLFHHKGAFYLAYTANENIAIAESDSPLGPFTQSMKSPLAAPVKQIDPFVFIDDDGKKYLYHVRLTSGNRLFVAEMTDDFSALKEETLRECITASEPWENTTQAAWPVAEGPTVMKHKGLYYLLYSANDFRNPDYAVGYATSTSPYGPWKKHAGNPILSRKDLDINGPGHGDFVKDEKGNLYYVFHTHFSNTKVSPRKTAIARAYFSKENASGIDKITIDKSSIYYPRAKGH